jgi:photosystem II stability/assembly factor-like uncharacterized protein
MRFLLIIIVCLFISACTEKSEKLELKPFTEVKIEPILTDSTLSIRAIDILDDGNLVFAANNGTYGMYQIASKSWQIAQQTYDSLKPEFRAVAHTSTDFFMLSVGSPALLYKTGDSGKMELVYKEVHPKAFYDAMTFWNDIEGIAIGDPTDDCLSIIITRDGGQTWQKISCNQLPKIKEGEAAFAASNTNIAIVGDKTWVATGGNVSRVFYSEDKGYNWTAIETPMINGLATTGIYSIDFNDEMNGVAIGGDYTNPNANEANKIITSNGGKTWQLAANNSNPGYRSCVQYVPNSDAEQMVAVGFKGIDYSSDGGVTWQHLSDASFYTIRFINDTEAFAAGKAGISKLIFK